MLDDFIIEQLRQREKKQRDSGWQPIPLYEELEAPQRIPWKKEESPSGPVEIDIWGPEADDNVVQTYSPRDLRYYL